MSPPCSYCPHHVLSFAVRSTPRRPLLSSRREIHCPIALRRPQHPTCRATHPLLYLIVMSMGRPYPPSFDLRWLENDVVRSTLWYRRRDHPLPPLSPPQNDVERGTSPRPSFPHQKTYDWWRYAGTANPTKTPSIGLLLPPSLTPPHS